MISGMRREGARLLRAQSETTDCEHASARASAAWLPKLPITRADTVERMTGYFGFSEWTVNAHMGFNSGYGAHIIRKPRLR